MYGLFVWNGAKSAFIGQFHPYICREMSGFVWIINWVKQKISIQKGAKELLCMDIYRSELPAALGAVPAHAFLQAEGRS